MEEIIKMELDWIFVALIAIMFTGVGIVLGIIIVEERFLYPLQKTMGVSECDKFDMDYDYMMIRYPYTIYCKERELEPKSKPHIKTFQVDMSNIEEVQRCVQQ